VEFVLLRRGLQARIGHVDFSAARVLKLWAAALVAAALALLLERALHLASPVLRGLAVLIPYGAAYLILTHLFGVSAALSSILARLGLKR
jgi:putative peptidoglycan lipid II flippase